MKALVETKLKVIELGTEFVQAGKDVVNNFG